MAIHEAQSGGTGGEAPFYRSGQRVLTLTYQSVATTAPGEGDLQRLLKQARSRNRAAGVTGMLLFSDNRFFQWLEGPEAQIDKLWASISRDARHTRVEVLNREFSQCRLFTDWDMRLVAPEALFDAVCQQTRARRSLPPKLVELTARLALDGRLDPLRTGIEDVVAMGVDLPTIYSGLIEPAAHLLGDWWQQDECDEREIALALYSLRSVIREIAEDGLPAATPAPAPLRVLLIPPPDEPHMLGVSLANDLYHQAGCRVAVEFPASHDDVGQLVARRWFDVLTLSMSDVFNRHEKIDALAAAVTSARSRSLNPGLVVVVGGRALTEKPSLVKRIGADAVYTTLADIVQITRDAVESAASRSMN